MAKANTKMGTKKTGGNHEGHKAAVSEQVRVMLDLETLADRKRDSLDFHEISVASIRTIIDMAFAAGVDAANGKPVEPAEKPMMLFVKTTRGRTPGGQWVGGYVGGFAFECLVFPEHAESESFELERSRISKLWICDAITGKDAASFDRGWDMQPSTDKAKAAVKVLVEQLAVTVFGK